MRSDAQVGRAATGKVKQRRKDKEANAQMATEQNGHTTSEVDYRWRGRALRAVAAARLQFERVSLRWWRYVRAEYREGRMEVKSARKGRGPGECDRLRLLMTEATVSQRQDKTGEKEREGTRKTRGGPSWSTDENGEKGERERQATRKAQTGTVEYRTGGADEAVHTLGGWRTGQERAT